MKINYVKLLAIAVMVLTSLTAFSQSKFEKQAEKARVRAAKVKLREMKREGYKVDGTSYTLELALYEHYAKLNNAGTLEIVGSVTGCKSRNVCQNAAINNAIIKYAQNAASKVKGIVESEIGMVDEELDKFYSAYERAVVAQIKGELQYSFSAYKTMPDGTREYDSYFVIDEEAARTSRIRACEAALQEQKLNQEYANKISEYVNQKVDSFE